jgi:hypothetical protein
MTSRQPDLVSFDVFKSDTDQTANPNVPQFAARTEIKDLMGRDTPARGDFGHSKNNAPFARPSASHSGIVPEPAFR